MATKRIPFINNYNTRGVAPDSSSTDVRIVNYVPVQIDDDIIGKMIALEPRPGYAADLTLSSGNYGAAILALSNAQVACAFTDNINRGGATSTAAFLYYGSAHLTGLSGGLDGTYDASYLISDVYISETTISGVLTVVFVLNRSNGTATRGDVYWYDPDVGSTTTFTGDLHSNTTIDNIASTTTLRVGQLLSHASLPAGTRIATISGATSITITNAATATTAGVTITRELAAKVIHASVPTNIIGNYAHMDGYAFYALADGNIGNTEYNTIATHSASNVIPSVAYPDGAVGVMQYRNLIAVLGLKSLQFFHNAGLDTGSPLQPVSSGAFRVGCDSARAITQIGETHAWYGYESAGGDPGIFVLDGMGYKRISTSVMERQFVRTGVQNKLYLTTKVLFGKPILSVIAYDATTPREWCFDIETGRWFEWADATALKLHTHCTSLRGSMYTVMAFQISGKRYQFQPASPVNQDEGATITRTIVTSNFDAGTRKHRKRETGLSLLGSKMASTHSITISRSDNDYASYNTGRTIDMSKETPIQRRGGSFKRRAWKIVDTNNAACRLVGMEVEYELLTRARTGDAA